MSELKFTRRFMLGGALVTVTALHLTGCSAPDTGIVHFDTDGQFFTASELTRLNDVAEIMIPRTDTPGAADAEVAAVVDGLMLTWAIEPTRQQFRDMLAAFDAKAKSDFGKDYEKLLPEERLTLVEAIDTAAFSETPPESAEDYKRLKDLVFRVFYTSEEASADHVPIPGGYYGNLTLEEYEALMDERAYGR